MIARYPLLAVFCLLALASAPLFAGGKKPPGVAIRLHGEGSAADGPSFVSEIDTGPPHGKTFIKKVPEVNERDIKSFYPFPGHDGLAGAYFRLDAHGANKLMQFTTEENGRAAFILINGRIVARVKIDGAVRDGVLYVPGGLLPSEILALQQIFPVIGEDGKAVLKKSQPAPKP